MAANADARGAWFRRLPAHRRPLARNTPPGLIPARGPRRPISVLRQRHRHVDDRSRPVRRPLRRATIATVIGLLAVTGMRPGKSSASTTPTSTPTALLTVRHAKLGKHRLLPLHSSTVDAVNGYRRLRDAPSRTRSAQRCWSRDRHTVVALQRWADFRQTGPHAGLAARSPGARPASTRLCRPLRYADLGAIVLVAQGIPPDEVGITMPNSIIVSFPFATRRRRAWSGQRAG